MTQYTSETTKDIRVPLISNSVPIVPTPPDITPTINLSSPTPKEKIEQKVSPIKYYVKASFMITYILLLTTATITFIEAMRTKTNYVRHVLNLETCISIVAGYFYSVFIAQLDDSNKLYKDVDWNDVTKTRYIDWTITTPMMLLTLCIVLGSHINKKVPLFTLLFILALNYSMLFIGYLGETNVLSKLFASAAGFVPFVGMFYVIFKNFVEPQYVYANYYLFFIYLIVWGLYGIVYLLPEMYKNICMNILDSIAKCLIGLGLWAYYSNIIVK